MIEELIRLMILVALFVGAAYGAYWLIGHLPDPWKTPTLVIVTFIFLIILLVAVANYFGSGISGRSIFGRLS
jgi:hypothetical protein